MSAIAKAARHLTAMNVPSISPEMGMFLVRVAEEVKVVARLLNEAPADQRDPEVLDVLIRYLKALNTVIEMAAHQQVSVIGVLLEAKERGT